MKTLTILILAISIVLTSCATNTGEGTAFNDQDIHFELLNSTSSEQKRTYEIEVINMGKVPVEYINFYMSYPLLQSNGAMENPYKIEGTANDGQPIILKSGEKVVYRVSAPITKVFGNKSLLDFTNPNIELKGYVKVGGKVSPFGMACNLEAFQQ